MCVFRGHCVHSVTTSHDHCCLFARLGHELGDIGLMCFLHKYNYAGPGACFDLGLLLGCISPGMAVFGYYR